VSVNRRCGKGEEKEITRTFTSASSHTHVKLLLYFPLLVALPLQPFSYVLTTGAVLCFTPFTSLLFLLVFLATSSCCFVRAVQRLSTGRERKGTATSASGHPHFSPCLLLLLLGVPVSRRNVV
jgi:hypothetical protein